MQNRSPLFTNSHFLIVLFSSLFCISGYESKAQLSHRVLFLGNSYTSVNDLPQLVHDVALSAGDTLIFDSYSPGGYTLENHSLDSISQNKIMAGWDYVIMQGQSQEPIMSSNQFTHGAYALCSQIKQYNPCAVPMTYMTWGRKNGDAANCPNFPEMCTYQSMDSALRENYLDITDNMNAEVSPVSVVWNYTRQNFPNIELYQPDESHPSTAGTYAAACCIYASIFKKDPALITYDFGLSAADAAIIRSAATTQVFDSLQSWDFKKSPVARITFMIGQGNEIDFHAVDLGANQTFNWDFGDGDTSSSQAVTHTYLTNGTYTVTLTTTNCDLQGVHTSTADTVIQLCSHTPTVYTSQTWICKFDTLWTQPADSYQWYAFGLPIPETNQYLADYIRYGISGFNVMTTVNGCSELSVSFNESADWSGYYFDAMGNPCVGDTVSFAVLHINGFLSGLENILWYKNDSLLSSMTNEDTLLVSAEGKYECKVIDPASNCPLDTTSSIIEYDCSFAGVAERDQELEWAIFPNPASETITINFTKTIQGPIQIYSAVGRLVRSINGSASMVKINIDDLAKGVYFVRVKNNVRGVIKFIKF